MFNPSSRLRTPAALFILLALLSGLVGCSSPTPTLAPTVVAPTVDLQPTLAAVQTQAVQTVVANLTKNAPTAVPATATLAVTATTAPTATQAVTNTPVPPTAAPTATYVPWTLTPTVAPYSCTLIDVLPKVSTTYAVNTNFDAQWIVKNNGTAKWLAAETDVRYSAGTKMQKLGDIQDLKNDVAPGENYTILMDMVTPATVGTYTDTFVLITGKITICTVSVTVTVK
jgi:hypothetical protein